MGIEANKEKVNKILEKSMTNANVSNLNKSEYHHKIVDEIYEENERQNKGQKNEMDDYGENDSFDFSFDEAENITSPLNDVKNIKKFPYLGVGVVTSIFPLSDEEYLNTCFLIDTNVVVTLVINLDDKNKVDKLNL